MSETAFKKMYPEWERFEAVRAKYGAIGKFASSQSKRLGLQ
jgi:decaprenylphospho-beta-D-ribofuranose 2-oxidase